MTRIGIYEKALPKNKSLYEKLKIAKGLGFDFIEMSIDETKERIERLDWTNEDQMSLVSAMNETGIKIQSICLSVHRRYPLGSNDINTQKISLNIMEKAIKLASNLGVRVIQLAGYDVYYEQKSILTRAIFIENLRKSVEIASKYQVIISIETMDDPFINSIEKYFEIKNQIKSPFLQVYPDLGNLSAWPQNNVAKELEIGINDITSIHVKDTIKVTNDFPGKFRDVDFGEGCVDFDGCFRTLKRLGYSGTFLIEMWSENSGNVVEEIIKAREFIGEKLKKAGY